MSPAKLNVAVVGLGIGRQHITAYKALPEQFNVAAICSVDDRANREVSTEFSISTVLNDFDALLRLPEVDVIDICTPPMLHRPQILAALLAGKHVICEKPLTNSVNGVDEIIAAERQSGCRVMPIFQYRFGEGLQKLKYLVNTGLAGQPTAASVEVHWRRRADYYAVPWRGKFATELGGALTGHAIHALDMLTYVFGPVRGVFARTATRTNPIEVEDTAAVTFEHESGALSTMSVTLGSSIESTRHRFVYSDLVAESNTRAYSSSGDPWIFTPDRNDIAKSIETALASFDWKSRNHVLTSGKTSSAGSTLQGYTAPAGYEGQFTRFHTSLVRGDAFPVTLDDARNAIQLLTAMYYSAATGQFVVLPLPKTHEAIAGWHQ